MILELNNICKDYRQGKLTVPVLKDVCLSAREGDYIAIMGPSGSGKTTLMNIIGCLDVATSGQYRLSGMEIAGLPEREMTRIRNQYIGFVFQTFHLLPKQSALDNVALPLLYAGVGRRERRERAAAALEKVGLGERMHFLPGQLSGGQCQRVAIARAMINKPSLLLADEPTGALDTKSGRMVMELFAQLHEQGTTILLITHDPEVAQLAKTLYRIRDGVLTREGETAHEG